MPLSWSQSRSDDDDQFGRNDGNRLIGQRFASRGTLGTDLGVAERSRDDLAELDDWNRAAGLCDRTACRRLALWWHLRTQLAHNCLTPALPFVRALATNAAASGAPRDQPRRDFDAHWPCVLRALFPAAELRPQRRGVRTNARAISSSDGALARLAPDLRLLRGQRPCALVVVAIAVGTARATPNSAR